LDPLAVQYVLEYICCAVPDVFWFSDLSVTLSNSISTLTQDEGTPVLVYFKHKPLANAFPSSAILLTCFAYNCWVSELLPSSDFMNRIRRFETWNFFLSHI
jgi:hypothetical protein